ncbi:hypothetical protein Cs7R123_72290 [Catellatospora sp. TT07R-123]|uniref:hypothetical protein n=1 Tax=Catellatospora sp. TT07R-123 TaxID=2733863 RepID=UPI001B030E8C|nr:hypothetical protein [Catellatospora sp. TT07R-123]GHJ49887.1 hypothetical protein Cs7R123_72290 [Catellatospora sp. TT07R-123]
MEWPCHTRRRQLLAQFYGAPASLAICLARHLIQACLDLPTMPSGLLHQRFLGWLDAPHRHDRDTMPANEASEFTSSALPTMACDRSPARTDVHATTGYGPRRPGHTPKRAARHLLAAA